jgi:hypothetical protein
MFAPTDGLRFLRDFDCDFLGIKIAVTKTHITPLDLEALAGRNEVDANPIS